MALTDKQERFVQEYLVDLNATQAAIRAGYSEHTARSQGQRLLTKVDIQAAIQARQAELREKTEITQERVLDELSAIAFAVGTDYSIINEDGEVEYTPTAELTERQRKAVAIAQTGRNGTEIKMHDKVRALELLGKHLGIFTERVEHEGEIKVTLDRSLEELSG